MAGDHVDKGRFAGAVGSDHTDGLLRRHADGDIARRDQRSKAFAEIHHLEYRRLHGVSAFRRQRIRAITDPSPCGKKRMVSSSTEPSSICQSWGSTAKANERTDSNTRDPTKAGTTDPAPERMVMNTNSPEVVQ